MNGRAAGGRPTKAQAAARTEMLLDTAREVFCRKGFAGTSLDEIAALLRSSKHTIYRRYPGKLELLEAVVERDVDRFQKALAQAGAAGADPVDTLRAMARSYFGFGASRDYAALYAAISLEAATSGHLRNRLREWASAALVPLREAIAVAMPQAEPGEACEVLIDLLDGAANRARWSDDAQADPGALNRSFTARWDIFRRAMAMA